MERKTITIEAAFWLAKFDPKKNILDGKYDFKFPPDWRNIVNKDLSITIPSITCIPCPLILNIYGLVLHRSPISNNTEITRSLDFGLSLSFSSKDGMLEANTALSAHKNELFDALNLVGV
jgi:hypothetical protein